MKMMSYEATRFNNIYRVGNRYRVRKSVNGKRKTKMFEKLKDCHQWLKNLS